MLAGHSRVATLFDKFGMVNWFFVVNMEDAW